MPVDIKPLPEIPQELADAAARGTLVPFIGAGVSALAGCPRWGEFADQALQQLVEQGKLNAAQRSQFVSLPPRTRLSLAQLTAQRHGVKIDFQRILQSDPKWHQHAMGRTLYRHLSALGSRFVTTNYDEWLDRMEADAVVEGSDVTSADDRREPLTRRVLVRAEDITPEKFDEPNTVVHLHGALADPGGMILSTRDYLRRYAGDRHRSGGNGENVVLSFLEFLFDTKTVLFVGYGLEELEILEHIVLKAGHAREDRQVRHYMLQGFFSFETALCDALRDYFLEQCGIELIPFLRDEEDWAQLVNVLEHFARQLPRNDPLLVQDFREMEALVDD